jgi:hypothetical protein
LYPRNTCGNCHVVSREILKGAFSRILLVQWASYLNRLASSMNGLFSDSLNNFHSAPRRLEISELCIFGFSWAIFRRCPRDQTMKAFMGLLMCSWLWMGFGEDIFGFFSNHSNNLLSQFSGHYFWGSVGAVCVCRWGLRQFPQLAPCCDRDELAPRCDLKTLPRAC